jgi:4-hydroxy-3-methylbut-2-enyl diphosphate reductase
MSSRLLIAAPLRVEALIVGSAPRGARAARVRKTGMGPKHAMRTAAMLARTPGRALLVLGFCGGLDTESVPGEVIVAEAVLAARDEGHSDATERIVCADAAGLTEGLRDRGMTVRSGEIVCVSKIALGERRAQLLADGAIAVDMESVWLTPGAAGRPFAVVRVVLDSPSHELLRPQAVAGALRAARVLRRVAGALRDWPPPPPPPPRESQRAGRSGPETVRDGGSGSAGLHEGSPEG